MVWLLSPVSCAKATTCYPSLKTTKTCCLIKSASLISNMSMNHYPVPVSAADTISSVGPRVGPWRHPPGGYSEIFILT